MGLASRDIRIKFFAEKGLTPNSHDFLGLLDPSGHGLDHSWCGGVLAEKGGTHTDRFFRDRLGKQLVPSINFSSFLSYHSTRGTNFSPQLKSQKESTGMTLGAVPNGAQP